MSGLASLTDPAFRYRGSEACNECGEALDGGVAVIANFRDGSRWLTHLRCTRLDVERYRTESWAERMDPQDGAAWVAFGGGAESALHIARAIRERDLEAVRARKDGLRKMPGVERGRLKKIGARVKELEAELEALR